MEALRQIICTKIQDLLKGCNLPYMPYINEVTNLQSILLKFCIISYVRSRIVPSGAGSLTSPAFWIPRFPEQNNFVLSSTWKIPLGVQHQPAKSKHSCGGI